MNCGWLYFQCLTRKLITIISQGLFYREFKDVCYVYHIIGICIASGLNQCNPNCSYINFPSPVRESFLWVIVGCRAMMNCIKTYLTISRLNWIRKTSLISRVSLNFYLFWIGNKDEKNYEEKQIFHWFLYCSGTERCFYSSTFAIYLRCSFAGLKKVGRKMSLAQPYTICVPHVTRGCSCHRPVHVAVSSLLK